MGWLTASKAEQTNEWCTEDTTIDQCCCRPDLVLLGDPCRSFFAVGALLHEIKCPSVVLLPFVEFCRNCFKHPILWGGAFRCLMTCCAAQKGLRCLLPCHPQFFLSADPLSIRASAFLVIFSALCSLIHLALLEGLRQCSK